MLGRIAREAGQASQMLKKQRRRQLVACFENLVDCSYGAA